MGTRRSTTLSRRRVLKAGAAAMAGGATTVLGAGTLTAQGAPAVLTNTQAGRRFRAVVKYSTAPPSIVELTARALTGRLVLIRTEAAQTCYTSVRDVLMPSVNAPQQPGILGHGGVGIVEAVGPQAVRVRPGDRVVVAFHAACGSCHNCLWMRSDQCVNRGGATAVPICDMGGTQMLSSDSTGMTELMIVHEEHAIPVFTSVSSPELAMLPCVGGAGLGMATTNCPVQIASDVVVFGAGPVGLSALQGARIKGASRLIMVEPIRYRRELALKLGATDVLDPNQGTSERPELDRREALDETTPGSTTRWSRIFATSANSPRIGSLPAGVGMARTTSWRPPAATRCRPKEAAGPDPTGITTLMQSWELCSRVGSAVSCTVGQPEDAFVQIPGSQFGDSAKHWWVCTAGGTNDRRDTPRYARLMETGQLNMKALVGGTYPLTATREAYQVCADRTVVATIVTPNA